MLSTIMWNTAVSPTGGSWDTATNWVGNQAPGSSDDAVIDLPGAGGTVTLTPVSPTRSTACRPMRPRVSISARMLFDRHGIVDRRRPDDDRRHADRRRHADCERGDELDGRYNVRHWDHKR